MTAKEDYYGAIIQNAHFGPRRELTLCIETWPKGKSTFGGGDIVMLRFGAIANHEQVQQFFTDTPADSFHYLREAGESRIGRHVIQMEFDRTGDRITIVAGNISIQVNAED